MDLKSRLSALAIGAPPPVRPEHARADAVLRGLAAPELRIVEGVLDRWAQAGRSADSAPGLEDLKPDDTGNVFDEDNKTLIATPEEWAVYARVLRALEGTP
jgi:hypothetical protein